MDKVVLLLLIFSSLLSARYSIIDDCDEVYNYWEPAHHLLYGGGFQTWEYAPQFALRSYWYPGAVALIGWPLSLFLSRLQVFFVLRALLGLGYAWSAWFFYRAARQAFALEQLGAHLVLAVGLVVAPGLFAASTALLPNSFSMCLFMISYGCWLKGLRALAVIFGAMGESNPKKKV